MTQNELIDYGVYIGWLTPEKAEQLRNDFPEIVRCKDCRWAVNIGYGWFHCRMLNGRHIDNWFCADGERKEDK